MQSTKSFTVLVLVLSISLIASGCPKKTLVKEEPSVNKTEELATGGNERTEKSEAEQKEREAREKELAKLKEAKKEQEQKEFEKSLVTKKTPGIEGEVLETKLLQDIHFDFDKYDVRPEDAKILKENADLLIKYPSTKIQIEGHCDERGTEEYNLALGERRANRAKKYLTLVGIPENRISIISYGKERPLAPGHNEETWAKNRRDHFVILSK